MPGMSAIHEFLRQAHVPYQVIPHPPTYTAREEAAASHVPGRDWAKVVVCFVDGFPVEAVVPATCTIDMDALLTLTRGSDIRLAAERELAALYPGCEPGAMPPFGPLYRQPVYVDVSLAGEAQVVFNAGTHTEAIVMRWADFVHAVRPIVGKFAGSARTFDVPLAM